jgi:predicted phosphodiesterase
MNILAISDIHFLNKIHLLKYDEKINYDYFIYVGNLLKDGVYNREIISNIVYFFNRIKIKKGNRKC